MATLDDVFVFVSYKSVVRRSLISTTNITLWRSRCLMLTRPRLPTFKGNLQDFYTVHILVDFRS